MKPVLKRLGLVAASPVLVAGVVTGCALLFGAQVLHTILASPVIYVATGKGVVMLGEIVNFWLGESMSCVQPAPAQRGEDPTNAPVVASL
jgi:hypothetical protein